MRDAFGIGDARMKAGGTELARLSGRLPSVFRRPERRTVVQYLVSYAVAAAIVWYAARGISWGQLTDAASRATYWLFVGG